MSYRLYNTVTFGITNQCNANCKFCIVECNTSNEINKLSEDVIKNALQDLAKLQTIKTIAFTGGEAFLDYEKLKRLVYAVNTIDKETAVYTNASWCNNLNVVRERLSELGHYGLKRILTSIDVEHQKYVPLRNLKNLLIVCNELGIQNSVHCVVQKSTLKATMNILEEISEELVGITVTMSSVMRIGKAERLIEKEQVFNKINIRNIKCSFDQMAYVDPCGNVYPCCMGNVPKCLCLGNIHQESIHTCLNRATDNPYFQGILKNGISWMLEIAQEQGLIDKADTYACECEVCMKILSNATIRSVIINQMQQKS